MRIEEHRNRNTDVNEYRNTWKQMEPGGPTHLGSRHGILITVIGNKLLWLLWIKLYHTPPHQLTNILSTYYYFWCLFIRCYICYILPVKGRRKQYDYVFALRDKIPYLYAPTLSIKYSICHVNNGAWTRVNTMPSRCKL